MYVGGSYALDDYDRGRSDLDVSAVTRARTPPDQALEIVAAIRHEVLPPARGLELVLYPLQTARAGGVEPGFDLNLNSGRSLEFRSDLEPVPGEGHWFAIDRSVLASHGLTLTGPAAPTVFRSASQPTCFLCSRRRFGGSCTKAHRPRTRSSTLAARFSTPGRAWTSKRRAALGGRQAWRPVPGCGPGADRWCDRGARTG